ncbi:MAG: LacI family transcriptional regulator [Streptococcaceae bacterium]|nr:LacI family transcriptional regulator [Streptococcaceae bacterium]
MVTINEVAESAGVSKSTVSRYIAKNGYVGKESALKIESAIKALNFVPNLSARSLKTKRSTIVGLLLPDITNPFFPMLAKGVEEYLQERGYQVLFSNIGDDGRLAEESLKTLVQSNAAGIISTFDFTEKYPDLNIPVVIVDRVGHHSEFGVFADNKAGGRLAAEKILEAGAKHIAVVSGPINAQSVNNRFKSSVAVLEESSAHFRTYYSKDYNFSVVREEAARVLDDYLQVDSIIAPSDIHAIAFIREILGRGLSIPEDIQVIGYDDILMSSFIYPALSTIHQPAYEMGSEAAKMIVELASNRSVHQRQLKLPVYYVERETLRKLGVKHACQEAEKFTPQRGKRPLSAEAQRV